MFSQLESLKREGFISKSIALSRLRRIVFAKIPNDVRVPSNGGFLRRLDGLLANELTPLSKDKLVPADKSFRPIWRYSIGRSPNRVVLFVNCHDDETTYRNQVLGLSHALASSQDAAGLFHELDFAIDVVVLDSTGLNDGWAQRHLPNDSPTRLMKDYFMNCLRSNDPGQQNEWAGRIVAPNGEVVPTRTQEAIAALIHWYQENGLRPRYVATAHGASLWQGSFVDLTGFFNPTVASLHLLRFTQLNGMTEASGLPEPGTSSLDSQWQLGIPPGAANQYPSTIKSGEYAFHSLQSAFRIAAALTRLHAIRIEPGLITPQLGYFLSQSDVRTHAVAESMSELIPLHSAISHASKLARELSMSGREFSLAENHRLSMMSTFTGQRFTGTFEGVNDRWLSAADAWALRYSFPSWITRQTGCAIHVARLANEMTLATELGRLVDEEIVRISKSAPLQVVSPKNMAMYQHDILLNGALAAAMELELGVDALASNKTFDAPAIRFDGPLPVPGLQRGLI